MLLRLLTLPAALLLAAVLASCGEGTSTGADDPAGETPEATTTRQTTECTYPSAAPPAREVDPPPADAVAEGEVEVTLATSIGELALTLDAAGAPCTVNSFVSLAEQDYFDGTECHRLTTQGIFVLQCGDPSGTGAGGPGYSFADEVTEDATYPAGTLAMANAGPDTNGSQFFVVYEDTELPPLYTVFGSIDRQSLQLVRDAAKAGSDNANGSGDGRPVTRVQIEEATVQE